VRVVISADEVLLGRGMRSLLADGGFEVVAVAGDADQLLEDVIEHRPDLVVTDIRLPPTFTDEGIRVALRLRELAPQTGVVVLSQHIQRRYAIELLAGRATGVGYLLKQRIGRVDNFLADLRRVVAGGTVLDPDVVSVALDQAERKDSRIQQLTARQREVLALFAQGYSNAAVATRLSITEKAVVAHASRIYNVLELPVSDQEHRRVRAVLHFLSA
jgi:DNA-binding NarL/FixJ family response regulator